MNFPNKENTKMAAILNFRIFHKNCKTQKCLYLKTVLDRAISTKFLMRRVSVQSSHPNFQKNFVSPKMMANLNFRIFYDFDEIFDAQGISAE